MILNASRDFRVGKDWTNESVDVETPVAPEVRRAHGVGRCGLFKKITKRRIGLLAQLAERFISPRIRLRPVRPHKRRSRRFLHTDRRSAKGTILRLPTSTNSEFNNVQRLVRR